MAKIITVAIQLVFQQFQRLFIKLHSFQAIDDVCILISIRSVIPGGVLISLTLIFWLFAVLHTAACLYVCVMFSA